MSKDVIVTVTAGQLVRGMMLVEGNKRKAITSVVACKCQRFGVGKIRVNDTMCFDRNAEVEVTR